MTWDHFTQEELTCHCGCGQSLMDHFFMQELVALRKQVGFALPVSSAYRCPAYNSKVSKKNTGLDGPHTKGAAVDIVISHTLATMLVIAALNRGFLGVGIRQHGPFRERIVHLDLCERPSQIIWTY